MQSKKTPYTDSMIFFRDKNTGTLLLSRIVQDNPKIPHTEYLPFMKSLASDLFSLDSTSLDIEVHASWDRWELDYANQTGESASSVA